MVASLSYPSLSAKWGKSSSNYFSLGPCRFLILVASYPRRFLKFLMRCGHQWKRVVARSRSGGVPAAQRRGELGILELLDAGEMAVDEAPIGHWPRDRQVLGWLQFRGIRAGATASVRGRARAGGRWCASLPSRRGRARGRSAWWNWRRRHGQTRPAPPRTAGWQTLMARWQMMRPGSLRAGWTKPTR